MNIEILQEPSKNNPFLIINKPQGLPSEPLKSGEDSSLTQAITLYPEIKTVKGKKEIEYGLLHRLDTQTSGLLLIATTQESYNSIQESQKNNNFIKWYTAKIEKINDINSYLEGFPNQEIKIKENSTVVIESYFRHYGKNNSHVRPVTKSSGKSALKKATSKLYKTEITLKENNIAICKITEGFRHQVRNHLAWLNIPVKGDFLYNPLTKKEDALLAFKATKIQFVHPITKEKCTFSLK